MEAIGTVLKNYYSDIRPNILKISTDIAEIRGSKDIGKLTLVEFTKYFSAVLELREYYKEIITKKAVLIEVESKLKRKRNLKWIIPTVVTVASAILGWALFHFLG